MPATDRRKILQLIINDPASTDQERTEAARAIADAGESSPPPSRRLGRNSNVAQSQSDVDFDIESHFRNLHDHRLDAQARRQIELGLSDATRSILAAFGHRILWLFHDNVAEIELMIGLRRRSQSDFVKAKALEVIEHIAKYSAIEAAKIQAQEFLQSQIDAEENQ